MHIIPVPTIAMASAIIILSLGEVLARTVLATAAPATHPMGPKDAIRL